MSPHLTLSTCFYIINTAKFPAKQYFKWMYNLFSLVNNNFYLIVYTDEQTRPHIDRVISKITASMTSTAYVDNIKVILRPFAEFHNYKYVDQWQANHEKNTEINTLTSWELNMIWAEKTSFVSHSIIHPVFPPTQYYGWCDIGYFRESTNSIQPNWGSIDRLHELFNVNTNSSSSSGLSASGLTASIAYALINNNVAQQRDLMHRIQNKNAYGLPVIPIAANQQSIAGGFFVAKSADAALNWHTIFDAKLALYFKHNYLVKDDQIIIADCVYSNDTTDLFILCNNHELINLWFMFTYILS